VTPPACHSENGSRDSSKGIQLSQGGGRREVQGRMGEAAVRGGRGGRWEGEAGGGKEWSRGTGTLGTA